MRIAALTTVANEPRTMLSKRARYRLHHWLDGHIGAAVPLVAHPCFSANAGSGTGLNCSQEMESCTFRFAGFSAVLELLDRRR
jgi:hypothetical protein